MSLRRVLFLLCLLPGLAVAEPLRVAVAVGPVAWLVDQVGGDRVKVQTLVRPGQDPHGFEPTPAQLRDMQTARLFFALGLPFEAAWLPRIRAVAPSLNVIPLAADHAGDHHDHGALDPHVWLDPHRMAALTGEIRDSLSAADPAGAATYAANAGRARDALLALDAELAAMFANGTGRTFLVHHAAWGHFAERYGLRQLALEQEGKEPGPRRLGELTAVVRQLGIDTLFIEPQASDHLAHGLADTLGLHLVTLDPNARDYLANLRQSAAAIRRALR